MASGLNRWQMIRAVVGATLAIGAIQGDLAQAEAPDLLGPPTGSASPAEPDGIARVRPVTIHRAALSDVRSGRIQLMRLSLFDRDVVTAVMDHVEGATDRDFTVQGRLAEDPLGSLTMVVRGDVIVGTIHSAQFGTYDIRTAATGQQFLRQLDQSTLTYVPCRVVPYEDGFGPRGPQPMCPDSLSTLSRYSADDGNTVDLMVVYTPAARDGAGGVAQIEALIDLAVAQMHQGLSNSQVPSPRLRVVRKALIQYTESGDGLVDLPRLATPGDGYLDSVHADRDQYGADLVMLWVNTLNSGGVAYLNYGLGSDDDGRSGFAVMRQDNAPYETLAHEIGHNFGCQHDRPNANSPGFFFYSYGFRDPVSSNWRTIMAYAPGTVILNYSNPNVSYSGPLGNPGPTGVGGTNPNTACNNALTIINTAYTLANYRPSLVTGAPPPRLYVRAAAPAGGNGASWATAFRDLQDAIGLAVRARGSVTEIWVASGTYKPDRGRNDRTMSFRLANGVAIYGGFAGSETLLSQRNVATNIAILSGDIGVAGNTSDNSYHVVNADDLNATAVLDGFTITGGNAHGPYPHNNGGGLRNFCGSPTIRNCRFTANSAEYAGGMYNAHGGSLHATNCTFDANTADYGGGAYNYLNAAPVFTGCTFTNNTAAQSGGAMTTYTAQVTLSGCAFNTNSGSYVGGVDNAAGSTATLTGCMFTGNTAVNSVGALGVNASQASVTSCTFQSNAAAYSGAIEFFGNAGGAVTGCTFTSNSAQNGGAVACYTSNPTLTQCTFLSNVATNNGGGAAVRAAWGSAPTISQCQFNMNTGGFGAGVYCDSGSNPPLSGCTFTGNTANDGAGMWISASSPTLTNCQFTMNTSGSIATGSGAGGAIVVDLAGSQPVISGCTFTQNSAGCCGGAITNYNASRASFSNCTVQQNSVGCCGGAIASFGASLPVFTNTTLIANSGDYGAGAFDADAGTAPTYRNCRFLGNIAHFSGGGAHVTDGAAPQYINAVFSGNRAMQGYGGTFYNLNHASPRLFDCTLSGNSASFDGGGLYNDASTNTIGNCIVWGNSDQGGANQAAQIRNFNGSSVSINYTILQGWSGALGGTGNLGSNPQFIDADGADNVFGTLDDNVQVPSGSPAVDSGSNALVPVGTTADASGHSRFINDPATPDTGAGTPPIVDRGAFEFLPPVTGDINCDGVFNTGDLSAFVLALLDPSAFATAYPGCPILRADMNADGLADGMDIQMFVSTVHP